MSLTMTQTAAFETAGRTIADGWIEEAADLARVSATYDCSAPGDVEYLGEIARAQGVALRGDDDGAIFRAACKGYAARVAEVRGE